MNEVKGNGMRGNQLIQILIIRIVDKDSLRFGLFHKFINFIYRIVYYY